MILRIAKAALLGTLWALPTVLAQVESNGVRYVTYQNPDGTTEYLQDNRKPALYTQNYGDCLGNSAISVTRFDAAYYQDNMTVLFHLAGNSALQNASVMMYIGVYAYGENRFDLTFNPCGANIYSMCPINTSVPITASGIIPVSDSDVANIPEIALSIPDFEGQAILRIFANDTQSEIGCYSAVVTNGASFSQPAGLGTTLGIFTLVALVASFATAAYGEAIPTMRLHYAHSLSVGVVFAVWQHIFFTGALSMNWPSVLVAWFSNFAWAGGMIYTDSMQNSINKLIGNYVGNTLSVGAAAAGTSQPGLGGGYDIHAIYGRSLARPHLPRNHPLIRNIASEIYGGGLDPVSPRSVNQKLFERSIIARDTLANASTGYKWYGNPVGAGLPLPGNYSGFAGTLAEENLRISNAFLTGFLWFLILLLIIIGMVVLFKGILELFARKRWMPQSRMAFFRRHWVRYLVGAVLRTCFIAFFMIMFLTTFQFTIQSAASVKAIAAIIFIIFLVGVPGIAIHACLYKAQRDGTAQEGKGFINTIPLFRKKATNNEIEMQAPAPPESKSSSKPFWRRVSSRMSHDVVEPPRYSVHDDEDYIMKYGWLASRFRRTKWWFFGFWLFYEFVRACFYGGASGHALVQVFGLLVVEILAFIFVLWAKPFEGRRLNVLVVYCLGFSKVTTVALSSAFDVQFNLQRIDTTVIGIVIIVIQGILMIITCIAIVVGAVSSYMSVSRNIEDFRPRRWQRTRERYFDHLDRVVNDLPPGPKAEPLPKAPKKVPEPEIPIEPYFEMKTMRRVAKIDDDDDTEIAVIDDDNHSGVRPFPSFADSRPGSRTNSLGHGRRTSSVSSHGNLPFGARPHKASWSMKDFDGDRNESAIVASPVDMTRSLPEDPSNPAPTAPRLAHTRTNSRGSTGSKHRAVRRQSDSDDLRVTAEQDRQAASSSRTRPRAGSHGSSGRTTPTNDYHGDQSQRKVPMLTPAQESEEFNGSYFDHR